MYKKEDDWDKIYNYDEEDSLNYIDIDEDEDPLDSIERLKGTVARGDCLYCGAKGAMEYEGDICFICSSCGKSTHEDIYYLWIAGHDIDFED